MNNKEQQLHSDLNSRGEVQVSLIIPVYNEAESINAVLKEALHVLDELSESYEVLIVNDGSTDKTSDILANLQAQFSALRVLSIVPNSGQSAAFGAGFCKSRGRITVMMDGDGQNDPHDIPRVLQELVNYDACCGYRSSRRDSFSKTIGSRFANSVRQLILHDGIKDTGCSLKAIKSEFLRNLPMELRGMHRFLPALLLIRNARITQIAVHHRHRAGGKSKYTNLGRLKETIWDLFAVRWMQNRYRRYNITEVK